MQVVVNGPKFPAFYA